MRRKVAEKKPLWPLLIAATLLVSVVFLIRMKSMTPQVIIRYVPIGDSYTIGEGVDLKDSYPSLLVDHLTKERIPMVLAENPAVSGYTTSDAIIYELPIFTASHPTFATVMLGANDIAQGISKEDFTENYRSILNAVQQTLPNKKSLILITIPDFSVTKAGKTIGLGRNIQVEIEEFNKVIMIEAKTRGVQVVDLTSVSREMETDETLVLSDGLHPTDKAYKQWAALLFPVAKKILTP